MPQGYPPLLTFSILLQVLPADLSRLAVKNGVFLCINTDAHHIDHLWMMKLGVGTARRGWVEAKHVINTFPLEKLLAFFKEKRKRFGVA